MMPDDRVVVIDCCGKAGVNLPVRLLTDLGVKKIDLLIVTHPDLDHVKGLADLLALFKPLRIWRYPFGLLREILALLVDAPGGSRYARHTEALRGAVALNDQLEATGAVEEITYGKCWLPPGSGYGLHALAPTAYDTHRARQHVRGLIENRRGRWGLSDRAKEWLNSDKPLGDLPNMVSIGIAIEWGQRRVVLAGDIENGDDTPYSGWAGVLDHLDRSDDLRGRLVDDVDLIKVAHHGSEGAFSKLAWDRHTKNNSAATGIITTFAPSKLPDVATLRALRGHCRRLGIAVDAGESFDRAMTAGWAVADAGGAQPASTAPCLCVVLHADGTQELRRGQSSGWFQ
jgi:hypothetical protein